MEELSTYIPIGTILKGTYRIDRHLASGGFGNTYLVTHLQLNEHLVVKEFFIKGINVRESDSTIVHVAVTENKKLFQSQKNKFKKEAQRIWKLKNDHIVRVHDLFEENDTVYYVMDYIDGSSLSFMMKRMGIFSEMQVKNVLWQILDALDTVHKAGFWHMDIKPDNIMMDNQGRCVLIDFGSSKQISNADGGTLSTTMTYTPGYAPIEQVDGSKDSWGPWTDFYALGATLYNLLTNNRPPMFSEISAKGDNAFSYPQPVSIQMRQVIRQMMQPIYSVRPKDSTTVRQLLSQSVSQMVGLTNDEKTAIDTSVIAQTQTQPQPVSEKEVPTKKNTKITKRKYWITVSVLAMIIVGLVIALFILESARERYQECWDDVCDENWELENKYDDVLNHLREVYGDYYPDSNVAEAIAEAPAEEAAEEGFDY